MTLGLTGKVTPYKKDVGPFPADIFRAPFPDARSGVTVEDALNALETLFLTDADPSRVAAKAAITPSPPRCGTRSARSVTSTASS